MNDIKGRFLAYGIAGHHEGLPNGLNDPSCDRNKLSDLLTRLDRAVPDAGAWADEILVPAAPDWDRAFPHLKDMPPDRVALALSHAIRMAFSALIDADNRDTEAFYAEAGGYKLQRGNWPSLGDIARQLDRHMASLGGDGREINLLRTEILTAAREAADLAPGLFSMLVPTGGGKTLAALVRALRHARRHGSPSQFALKHWGPRRVLQFVRFRRSATWRRLAL